MNSAQQMWESFAAAVIPIDAPPVQFTECRRAFYAGVWAMLTEFQGIGADTVSEEQGVAHLERIKAECEAFAAGVQAGKF